MGIRLQDNQYLEKLCLKNKKTLKDVASQKVV